MLLVDVLRLYVKNMFALLTKEDEKGRARISHGHNPKSMLGDQHSDINMAKTCRHNSLCFMCGVMKLLLFSL